MLALEPLPARFRSKKSGPCCAWRISAPRRKPCRTLWSATHPSSIISRYIMPDGQHTQSVHTRDSPCRCLRSSHSFRRLQSRHHGSKAHRRRPAPAFPPAVDLAQRRTTPPGARAARNRFANLDGLENDAEADRGFASAEQKRAPRTLKSCRALTSDAIREVRTISSILHPPLMDEAGLTAGLELLRSPLRRAQRRRREFCRPRTIFGAFPKKWSSRCSALRRNRSPTCIATPKRAFGRDVASNAHRTHVSLSVRDNGIGMALSSHRDRRNALLGIGIAGMRERVTQLQGEFHISQFAREWHHHSGGAAAGDRGEVRVMSRTSRLFARDVSSRPSAAFVRCSYSQFSQTVPHAAPVTQGESQ